jgi:hypothetical protein
LLKKSFQSKEMKLKQKDLKFAQRFKSRIFKFQSKEMKLKDLKFRLLILKLDSKGIKLLN